MNNVLFRRGDQTFIDQNVPLNDGQIIFNETDEAIYLDSTIGDSVVRKRYGGGNLSRSDIDMAFSTTSENPIANKVVTNAIGNLSSLQTDIKTNLVNAINEVDGHTDSAQNTANTANGKADIVQAQVSNSGDTYSTSKAYAVGDLCIYNNVLYRCITACSAGSWATNQSCFTTDTLTNAVSTLPSLQRLVVNNTNQYYWERILSRDTAKQTGGGTLSSITLSERGVYLCISEASINNDYASRILSRFTGNGATPTDYMPITSRKGEFGYIQITQVAIVKNNPIEVIPQYFTEISTGTLHGWRISKIL